MNYFKAAVGALAIMMASGMIADFHISERDNNIFVTVWTFDDQPDGKLRKHVAALLPDMIDEARIFVLRDNVSA